MQVVTRTHEIHCGHRVYGHGGKCKHLHGHAYVFEMVCAADNNVLDPLGMVIDFGDMKSKLCQWLEDNFDHRFLIWEKDPLAENLKAMDESVVIVPFNPTAENIAEFFVTVVAPVQLHGTGITMLQCKVNETSKCSATYTVEMGL